MKKEYTKEYKDSFITNDIASFQLDNNRKIVISTSTHNNYYYIAIRTFIRTQQFQGGEFIPTKKGLFFRREHWGLVWEDIDKIMRNLIAEDSVLMSKVA